MQLLHPLLIKKKITLAVAESCTSGSIASTITSIAGSSAYFKGGIIAYHNQIKIDVLKVSSSLIDEYTEVSYYVVEQMAKSVKKQFSSDVSIATSGYAGPGGGTVINPVGTVFFAVAVQNRVFVEKKFFRGTRKDVIDQATKFALDILLDKIKNQR